MNKGKILIVEDDRGTLLWLVVLLKKQGYITVTAQDGTMAMQVARKENPDLIILDINLPAGDGTFVLENLKKNTELCHIPVITITGDTSFDLARLRREGAAACFTKPTDNETLVAKIEQVLEASSQMPMPS